jgi:hypothetical protein
MKEGVILSEERRRSRRTQPKDPYSYSTKNLHLARTSRRKEGTGDG